MKEMVGGCCVCSDDRGWAENPLVYCDGQGCTVAVHQACYGIVTVPTGNWYCRKCESQEGNVKVKCELCPNKDGALKPTDNNAWAHVVCALYIPEVRFGNVTTMEPIILAQIPAERYNKTCYICEESNKGSRAGIGACMQCNKSGCRQQFHVTCAQGLGLLCEEAGNYLDNVKYCGYCHHHYTKLKKGGNVKVIPPYRPVGTDSPERSPKETEASKATAKRKLSTGTVRPVKLSEERSSGSLLDEVLPDPPKFTTANFTSSTLDTDKLGNKRRKAGAKTPPVVSEESRPSTPSSDKKPVGKTSPPQVSKPPVVPVSNPPCEPVPLSTPQSSSSPPVAQTEPSPPLLQQDHPIKRARSQSSDKSEKGRRSKRAGSKPTPPPPSTSPLLKIVMEEQIDPRASKKPLVIKEEKDVKLFHNGVNAPHMLGNQLNPSSTMAQKMCDTLSQEMVAHSVFSPDQNNLVGPQLPKSSSRNATNAVSSAIGGNWNHHTIPQSLEQLLERQWEQGSQFLMEQAQHFDIASLLSCLHQLNVENAQLDDHVNTLIQRRDHLLAVNARLAIPLVPPVNTVVTSGGGVGGHQPRAANSAPPSQQAPGVVENGLASPCEQQQSNAWRGARGGSNPHQPPPSFSPSNTPQVQNSVVVRASADLHRRGSQVVVGSQGGGGTQQQPSLTSNTNSFTSSSHFSSVTSTASALASVATATTNPQQGQQTPHPSTQSNQGVLRREVGDLLHHSLAPPPSSKPS